MENDRKITVRRNLEQATHCVVEALSTYMGGECKELVKDDIDHAVQMLSEHVLPQLPGLPAEPEMLDCLLDLAITNRRHLSQACHCLEEALHVVERGEDLRCAVDDVRTALLVLRHVNRRL